MSPPATPDRLSDSRIAAAPRSTACSGLNAEPNLPTGVLTAEAMTERGLDEPTAPVYARPPPGPAAPARRRCRMQHTSLLVIGAGPYGLSTAALARDRGIDTVLVGRPMSFWKEHMPAGMFLRSGPDWHLDASGVHTFEAFLEEVGIAAGDVDPIPLSLFLNYAEWFRQAKGVEVREDLVVSLTKPDGTFVATLEDGDMIEADAVVAAPGISRFTNLPSWAARLPHGAGAHTCDLVAFDDFSGARVLVVGGRQSAYEWAALIGEQGAERIDIVHRHETPGFE